MRQPTPSARIAGFAAFALVGTFATLVPGGPVETRSFAAMSDAAFWGFNILIIATALTALASGAALVRGVRQAAYPAIAAAWGFVVIVLLDLGHIFPPTPDAIPLLLGLVEILDLILALYVIAFAHKTLGELSPPA